MKQKCPFSVRLTPAFKKSLLDDAKLTGVHRGVFFSTSGKALMEQINPTALYQYIFRTDKSNE